MTNAWGKHFLVFCHELALCSECRKEINVTPVSITEAFQPGSCRPSTSIRCACRPGMLHFMLQCHEVAARMMSCFAIGLGLPEDYFVDLMDPHHDDCGTVRASGCSTAPQCTLSNPALYHMDCLERPFRKRLILAGILRTCARCLQRYAAQGRRIGCINHKVSGQFATVLNTAAVALAARRLSRNACCTAR